MAADAIVEGLGKGDVSKAQLGGWGPIFNEVWIACGGWSASSTMGSASAPSSVVSASARHHYRSVIGDLFTDRVDTVWGPMRIRYAPPQKEADSAMACGHAVEADQESPPHAARRPEAQRA